MIHLDTSFLIRALDRGTKEDRALRRWLHDGERFAASAIAWTQFLCGAASPEGVDVLASLLVEPLPFGAEDASVAARLYNDTGRRRGALADCMIAATALRAGAPLATADLGDFRRFEMFGLKLLHAA